MSTLLTKRIGELAEVPNGEAWLVRNLWPNQGVGIIGAEPKCGKTWLALDLAVSVASGSLCLGKYEVTRPGPVLFFNGEDAEHVQGSRLLAIAKAKGLDADKLNLNIIVANQVRLDQPEDVTKLRDTVAKVKPTLLILDPFVRMHRINENNSAKVAELLSKLRAIQKDFGTAIILVHHQKKAGGKNARGGSKIRGSSEFHAWGDANLYLAKSRDGIVTMDVELRTGASAIDVPVKLIDVNDGTCLQVDDSSTPTQVVSEPEPLEQDIEDYGSLAYTTWAVPKFESQFELEQKRILKLITEAHGIATLDLLAKSGVSVIACSKTVFELQRKGLIIKVNGEYYAKT